jgi:hypothetical protein
MPTCPIPRHMGRGRLSSPQQLQPLMLDFAKRLRGWGVQLLDGIGELPLAVQATPLISISTLPPQWTAGGMRAKDVISMKQDGLYVLNSPKGNY